MESTVFKKMHLEEGAKGIALYAPPEFHAMAAGQELVAYPLPGAVRLRGAVRHEPERVPCPRRGGTPRRSPAAASCGWLSRSRADDRDAHSGGMRSG